MTNNTNNPKNFLLSKFKNLLETCGDVLENYFDSYGDNEDTKKFLEGFINGNDVVYRLCKPYVKLYKDIIYIKKAYAHTKQYYKDAFQIYFGFLNILKGLKIIFGTIITLPYHIFDQLRKKNKKYTKIFYQVLKSVFFIFYGFNTVIQGLIKCITALPVFLIKLPIRLFVTHYLKKTFYFEERFSVQRQLQDLNTILNGIENNEYKLKTLQDQINLLHKKFLKDCTYQSNSTAKWRTHIPNSSELKQKTKDYNNIYRNSTEEFPTEKTLYDMVTALNPNSDNETIKKATNNYLNLFRVEIENNSYQKLERNI